MPFLEVIGELFGFTNQKGWALQGIDAGFEKLEFKGEHIAQNITEDIGSNLNQTDAINKEKPDFQWLHGDAETVTFDTRLYATNSLKNVKKQIEVLKSMARRDSKLKRAPRFSFTAGTEIGFTCFVRGIQFKYDELRSDGTIRGVVVSLSLQKIEDTITKDAGASLAAQIKFAAGIIAGAAGIGAQAGRLVNIPGGSLHTIDRDFTAKRGDTYETVAAAEYGDALLGDVLRRVQPGKPDLLPGDRVQLVEPTEIITIPVTPQSTPLKNTLENQALREEFLELRNRTTTIFV